MGGKLADVSVNGGVFKLSAVVFGLILVVVIVDALLTNRSDETYVGHWAQAWARRYPQFALAISFFFGALIGHFFWDSWSPG